MSVVRYRKRPVEVDTIQWTGSNEAEVQAFTGGASRFYALDDEDRENSDDPEATATVFDKLHSTWVLVYTGQHIVRGVKGEYYPIAEDVLAETYELADTDGADLLPKADVVAWLTKKAREFRSLGHEQGRAQADAVAAMASKVDRGAVRPRNLRMLPADFYEPGHTYADPDPQYDWQFRCDTVTAHPGTGERTALGWRFYKGKWEPIEYGEDSWEIHQAVGYTDSAEAGDGRG